MRRLAAHRIPTVPSLRWLISEAFPVDADLTAFLQDNFPQAYREISNGMERTARISVLLGRVGKEDIWQVLYKDYYEKIGIYADQIKYPISRERSARDVTLAPGSKNKTIPSKKKKKQLEKSGFIRGFVTYAKRAIFFLFYLLDELINHRRWPVKAIGFIILLLCIGLPTVSFFAMGLNLLTYLSNQSGTMSANSARFSFDGKLVAYTAGYIATIKKLDDPGYECTLRGHSDTVTLAAFSPDNEQLVTTSDDGTVRIWSVRACALQHVLRSQQGGFSLALFAPTGNLVGAIDEDWTVHFFSSASGKELMKIGGLPEKFTALSFMHKSGDFLTGNQSNNSVGIWSYSERKERSRLIGHTGRVFAVEASPDGQMIATAGRDRSVRLWRGATGEVLSILSGHKDTIWSVDFSPDGQRLVTASSDKTARIWNTNTGQMVQMLHGHLANVYDARYSPDGRFILTASGDHSVRLWNAETGDEVRQLARVWICLQKPGNC